MDDLTVKVQCLCNGLICHARTPEEAKQAGEFAIGTLPHWEVADVGRFYREALPDITNQYMCYEKHADIFQTALQKKHGGDVPGYFVIAEEPYQPPHHGILCARVSGRNQAEKAVAAVAHILICSQSEELEPVREAVPETVPVFAHVPSIKEATGLVTSARADGFVLNSVPDRESVVEHLRALVEQDSGWIKSGVGNSCRIGVLCHQGDFRLHLQALRHAATELGIGDSVTILEVRTATEIRAVDGLLMPGGWSNLQSWMLNIGGTGEAIKERVEAGMPLRAVCAGMILARSIVEGKDCQGRTALALLTMGINNNDIDSAADEIIHVRRFDPETGAFVTETHTFSNGPSAFGFPDETTTILAQIVGGRHDGKVVGLRQGNVSVFAIHEGIHEDFVSECVAARTG